MDDVRLLERYNPKLKGGFDTEAVCYILESIWCYKVSEYEDVNSLDEASLIYDEISRPPALGGAWVETFLYHNAREEKHTIRFSFSHYNDEMLKVKIDDTYAEITTTREDFAKLFSRDLSDWRW